MHCSTPKHGPIQPTQDRHQSMAQHQQRLKLQKLTSSLQQTKNTFLIFRGTETALKKQLLETVSDTFTKTLKHKMYGYAQVTAREILAHLDAAYGTVDADDIKDNEKRMNATWNPSQPIKDLYNQVKDAQKFAADHDDISEKKEQSAPSSRT
ncbi:hypothetical protein SEMRO_1844_G301220.1 [Seminavis robusta]|uniref:Uncharacterized protein n=1 Tax=Seminavis robusta TaxID=568900 RepID=A0A9N8EV13_9STRA|nr:hypothetical protein SEMRO_1844_G301220.1 [Seminavis robusta]|eukprot:Sro1844_g301220.1 n/a (152) ;mRNA; r:1441-1896